MTSVLDGFEKFLRISVKSFAGILNAYIELVQTISAITIGIQHCFVELTE